MSLINDALKRADADKPRNAQSGPTADMQPVDSAAAKPSHLLPWALLLVGVGAVGIAAALWFRGGTPQQAAANPTPAVAQPAPNPIQQATKTLQAVAARNDEGLSSTTQPTVPPKTAPVVAKAPAPSPAPSPTPKKVAAATSTEPKPIRLQSIFYRMKSPTVIINGKTLRIGDSVDGIKVVSIQRTSVEVVQNGKYRTLTLQD